jgi:hypothetical protein
VYPIFIHLWSGNKFYNLHSMNKTLITPRLLLIISVIAGAAFLRLIPHWPNFTPIAGIALFGGTYLGRKHLALIIPFAAMLLSDLFLGFHQTMLAVYIGFAIIVGIGFLLRKRVGIITVLSASLVSSLVFFLVTNFASWQSGMMPYPMNFNGLIEAYVAGLPFLNNGILGDLFYNSVLFGGFYLVTQKYPQLAKL